jgi:hypothetical protein
MGYAFLIACMFLPQSRRTKQKVIGLLEDKNMTSILMHSLSLASATSVTINVASKQWQDFVAA